MKISPVVKMASNMMAIRCFCNEAVREVEKNSEESCFVCEEERCKFYLNIKNTEEVLSIPTLQFYFYQLREIDGEMKTGIIKSYRQQRDHVWLEFKKKIPRRSFNDLLKQNAAYLHGYKTSFCRALANTICMGNEDIGMIKQLMAIEAYQVIRMTRRILQARNETLAMADAIEKYFSQARNLADEQEIEKLFLKTVSGPNSVSILNILTDKLRKSDLWDYVVKDIDTTVLL